MSYGCLPFCANPISGKILISHMIVVGTYDKIQRYRIVIRWNFMLYIDGYMQNGPKSQSWFRENQV